MDASNKQNGQGVNRSLPTSMDWFRQSANWLVGLSSGGLAWLGSMYFDRRAVNAISWVDWLYAASALAFVVAIVAGVSFYSWLTYFANQYEQENNGKKPEAKEGPAAATGEGEAPNGLGTDADTSSNPTGRPDKLTKARRWYGFYFNILKWAFPIAVVLSAGVVGAQRLAGESLVHSAGSVLLIDGRNQDSTCTKYSVLKLDTKTGLVLELFNDETSGWVRWDTCHAFAREVNDPDRVRIR